MATEEQFDEWCDAVEAIVSERMGGRVDEQRQMKWDYSFYFNSYLTPQQAADDLYQFLNDPASLTAEDGSKPQ